jgi:hypothetical protein
VHNGHTAGKFGSEIISDLPCAVLAVIIHNEHIQIWQRELEERGEKIG